MQKLSEHLIHPSSVAADPPNQSDGLLTDVLSGLRQAQKMLPTHLLYDERGSLMFEAITKLKEYYLTRSELEILAKMELSEFCPVKSALIELGCGSCLKARTLLSHNSGVVARYVGIDISESALRRTLNGLWPRFAHIKFQGLNRDFLTLEALPSLDDCTSRVLFFPGSTIGNFEPSKASQFLKRLHAMCSAGDTLIVGVDLRKSRDVLLPAYNDARGVTSEFNKNVLTHLNRRLGTDFHEGDFRHEAVFNEKHGRIEMHLVSLKKQSVRVGTELIDIDANESICTEYSYKYRTAEFVDLAKASGWSYTQLLTDSKRYFSVHILSRSTDVVH